MQKLNVLIPFCFAWFTIGAQPSSSSFLHYNTDQGLSNDHITGITKDKLGFIWISTINGLNRFDGRTFRNFYHDPKDASSIPGDVIKGITPAPDGWLWVATGGGLCKLDPVSLDIVQIPLPENEDSLKNDMVTKVEFDSKGMAWTTGINGIYQINPLSGRHEFFYKTEEENLGWHGMLIDEHDRIWLIKDYLHRFDPAKQHLQIFNRVEGRNTLGALSLVKDHEGQIWAGTWSEGIWKFDASSDTFISMPISESLAMMLLPDYTSSGRPFFWIGGGQSGLAMYYPDTYQFIRFNPDPQDDYTHNNYLATTFFKDPSSGDVWIGTEVGLEQYAPATIRFGRVRIPTEKDMGQFSLVSGVVQDNTDTSGDRYFVAVWGSGLFTWNKEAGKITRMKSTTFLTGGSNFFLFQDKNGIVWGCRKNGISSYNPRTGRWRDYKIDFKYPERNNLFWYGMTDRKGNVWFGSNKEGLFRYNPKDDVVEHAFYEKEFTVEDDILQVFAISEDTTGRLWIAANAGGLIRFDPLTRDAVKFSYSNHNIPLHSNAVTAARNGRIYVNCYSDFLELDSEGKLLRQFNQQNGLKSNRLYFMVEDFQGKIWFNSVYLLHSFDPVTGTFSYYGKPDGLFSNTITDALSITSSGEIFVGFQNAFNYFYPDRLKRNLQLPPIAVTSIKVMNEERKVSIVGNKNSIFNLFSFKNKERDTFLILRPNEDFFEIEFAALNFNQQERNRYAYLLDGFNKDWVYTDRPVATFTNLDGGTYLLHMKAANNDGIWNEQGATLAIKVNPSFYKTRWFPLLIVFIMGTIVAGFLWYRRQQRHRLEKFREVLARDLHDEMGSTLSSIRFFSEYADQQIGNDKPQVSPTLQRISQSATNLSESMQDIIWAMKTDHDHLEDLTSHMMEFGLRLLEARNIHFKTNIHEDFSGRHLQPEVRRNIYLIFKEAINNAAKYSDAKEVEFTLTLKKGLLCMQIRDNGKGFDNDSLQSGGGGNGLQNMRQRAKDIQGKLEIYSIPGQGTKVELKVEI